ncbi:EF-hand calcium-binding domain-containing protein 6-like [Pelodytes ibericus]
MAGSNGKSSGLGQTKLPNIRHPVSQMENPETLSIRGHSRNVQREEVPSKSQSPVIKKPLLQDFLKTYRTTEEADSWRALDNWLQDQLLEKINSGGYYHLKHLFFSNDPEGRGRVARDSLLLILATFLGRYVSTEQTHQLLQTLHLGNSHTITFDAFYECFKKEETNDSPPDWLDPMKRKQKPAAKSAHEAHLSLKEMADNRYAGLDDGILEKENLGVTHSRHLDNQRRLLLSGLEKVSGSHWSIQSKTSKKALSNKRTERKLSLSIEKWLKEKFRTGSRAMMAEFQTSDPHKTGKVSKEDFLSVLDKFNLQLTSEQLGHFLSRCGLDEGLPHVNYVEFLQRLQSRPKNGASDRIWGRRVENRNSPRSLNSFSGLEEKLVTLLHADYNSLLNSFQRADAKHLNVISHQDFRAIMEARYSIKLTDEEFACLLERLPVDHSGGIRYLDFMARFDGSDGRWSLFDGAGTVLTDYSRKPNGVIRASGSSKERTVRQLAEIIKNLVKNNYNFLEMTFSQVDVMNTRRLTSESMYQLLKRCDLQPPVCREEVKKIWETFILNQDQTVDFFQFVRHFGFSPKSSCFPNANISPPVKGDGDFLLRSRKVNSDTQIIANILQTKVKLHLDELWIHFKELDPTNSGYVTEEEFLDILQDLSPDLTKHQCDSMATKFGDGHNRVSFGKFLQPYQTGILAPKGCGVKIPKKEDKVLSSQQSVQHGLHIITSKLRQKLSRVEWKNLHQACQKLDHNKSGFLQFPEFRSVVKLCNIVLDEDDIYQIMSQYDKDLAGKINYSKLVSDHNKIR